MQRRAIFVAIVSALLMLCSGTVGASPQIAASSLTKEGLSRLDFSIECGWQGAWTGDIVLENGLVEEAMPILFETNDAIVAQGSNFVKIAAASRNEMDGVRIVAQVRDDAKLKISLASGVVELLIKDLEQKRLIETTLKPGAIISVRLSDYDAWGKEGGHYEIPDAVVPTWPAGEIVVPGDGWDMANTVQEITLELADKTALDELDFRHFPGVDGRLRLELFSSEEFSPAKVTLGGTQQQIGRHSIKSLSLNLPAFIGYYKLRIGHENEWREINISATSIGTKGSKLYVNGDEFLSKGGLVQERDGKPTSATSFFLKNIGFNTIIATEDMATFDYHEDWGFARVIKTEMLNILKQPIQTWSEAMYRTQLDSILKNASLYKSYIASPMVIATFFANESTKGSDTWMSYHKDQIDEHGRLSSYLTQLHNAVKQMSPMMPTSYANHTLGYRLPTQLDVYMHNSYYYIDRYPIPLEDYMKWQGFPDRPFYMKEFGSNTYLEEIYQGGRNNPIYGKVRQWAFEERWNEYLQLGAMGGAIYTVFDYATSSESRDGNTASFGVFTQDQLPKLMTYGVWKEYIDLRVDQDGVVENRRNYPIRNLKLLLTGEGKQQVIEIDQLKPNGKTRVLVPFKPSFWTAQFQTHRGLLNQQIGACTEELFQQMFGMMLDLVENGDFLNQLLPTRVMGWDGQEDHYLMDKFEKDGVIAVAFEKAPGEYYLTAWTQNQSKAATPQTLTFFDTGDVRMLDDVTGKPLSTKLNYEVTDGKLIFHDVRIPWIGRSIEQRSATEIHLPVIQVSKNGFAAAPEAALSPNSIPDQFQLSGATVVPLAQNKLAQVFTNRSGSLGTLIISPGSNTGVPKCDVVVKIHPLTTSGLPDEGNTLATQIISAVEWDAHTGGLLSIEFNTQLKRQESYALVFSTTDGAENHRTLAAAASTESALTASYGPGAIAYSSEEGWTFVEDRKQSLFFITLAGDSTPGEVNHAQQAQVTVSSTQKSFSASAVTDGKITVNKGSEQFEWISDGERAGAWIRLSWDKPRPVEYIRLYDSSLPYRMIKEGHIIIDDDPTQAITSISFPDGHGVAAIVQFPKIKEARSITFVVDELMVPDGVAGMSEIAVTGPPLGHIWLAAPQNNAVVSGILPIELRGQTAPLAEVKVTLTSAASAEAAPRLLYAGNKLPDKLVWETTQAPDGAYDLAYELTTIDGKVTTFKSRIVVLNDSKLDSYVSHLPSLAQIVVDGNLLAPASLLSPSADSTVAGEMIIEAAGLHDLVVKSVKVMMKPVSDSAAASIEVFAGSKLPGKLSVDTLRLADGAYDLDYTISLVDGSTTAFQRRITVRNWEQIDDSVLPPVLNGWFGTLKQMHTVADSAGWEFTGSDSDELFGDADRAQRKQSTEESFTWALPRLKTFVFTLYSRTADINSTVKIEVSPDGQQWTEAEYSTKTVDNSATGWLQIALEGAIPQGVDVGYIRFVLTDNSVAPTDLEFGHALLRGKAQQ